MGHLNTITKHEGVVTKLKKDHAVEIRELEDTVNSLTDVHAEERKADAKKFKAEIEGLKRANQELQDKMSSKAHYEESASDSNSAKLKKALSETEKLTFDNIALRTELAKLKEHNDA